MRVLAALFFTAFSVYAQESSDWKYKCQFASNGNASVNFEFTSSSPDAFHVESPDKKYAVWMNYDLMETLEISVYGPVSSETVAKGLPEIIATYANDSTRKLYVHVSCLLAK